MAEPEIPPLRVVHVVSSLAEEAGGVSTAVIATCRELERRGCEVHIATLQGPARAAGPGVLEFPAGLGPRRLGRSPQMRWWLEGLANDHRPTIVHSHSLWMMPNLYAAWSTRAPAMRLVTSPHGTLSPRALAQGRHRKKLAWLLAQRRALHRAECLHAASEAEYADIRRSGLRQPVCLIPHGVDADAVRYPGERKRQVLYLGRLHPQKGVEVLLRAWARLEADFPDWVLSIAGPGDAGPLRGVAAACGLRRVSFPGPAYGEERTRMYREASLCILPSHSESFGLTVAEALGAGTPVVATTGTPWGELPRRGAGWWVELGVDSIVAALREAMSTPADELAAMGERGREWMRADFRWDEACAKLLDTYRWLLRPADAPVPSWMRVDPDFSGGSRGEPRAE